MKRIVVIAAIAPLLAGCADIPVSKATGPEQATKPIGCPVETDCNVKLDGQPNVGTLQILPQNELMTVAPSLPATVLPPVLPYAPALPAVIISQPISNTR